MAGLGMWMLGVGAVLSAVGMQVSAAGAQAHPPTEYCVELGGKASTEKRGDGVEIGICSFGGNMQCESWALYRLECPPGGVNVDAGMSPAARYCVIRGGKYSVAGKGQCSFDTGKVCDVTAYFTGRCE